VAKRTKRAARTRRVGGYDPEKVARRIREVVGPASNREVAEITGVSREAVRRFLVNGRPSVEFVRALCEQFGESADWLLGVRDTGYRPPPSPRFDRLVESMEECLLQLRAAARRR
jgi:transcriptional regulator with XRE-family HTH domain